MLRADNEKFEKEAAQLKNALKTSLNDSGEQVKDLMSKICDLES